MTFSKKEAELNDRVAYLEKLNEELKRDLLSKESRCNLAVERLKEFRSKYDELKDAFELVSDARSVLKQRRQMAAMKKEISYLKSALIAARKNVADKE